MIKVVNIDKFLRENKPAGPILSPMIYLGKTEDQFHPQGLFSEDIFGFEGSPEWKTSVSWIELNCALIHPVFFDMLKKTIERKIVDLISGEKAFTISDEGYLVEKEDGEITGFSTLLPRLQELRFRENVEDDDATRNKIVKMLHKNIENGTFLIDKLLVIPPGFRPISVMKDTNQKIQDPVNDIYQKIIRNSTQIKGLSGQLFDILSYKMQLQLAELHEYIRIRVSKKSGIIRGMLLGKRADFTARSVITPNPQLNIGYVGVPLRMAVQLFEPNMIYGLLNSPQSKNIPPEFFEQVSEFLNREVLVRD